MITLELSRREIEVIRQAMRSNEDSHTRNGFDALVKESQELRSKLSDAIIADSKAIAVAIINNYTASQTSV